MVRLEHFHDVELFMIYDKEKQAVLGCDFVIFAYFVTREEETWVLLIAFIQLARHRRINEKANNT